MPTPIQLLVAIAEHADNRRALGDSVALNMIADLLVNYADVFDDEEEQTNGR